MVDRQLKSDKLTVIDLDGTYLTCNSLSLYLKTALKYAVSRLRLDRVMVISALYLFRKLRLISHETMKYRAINFSSKSPAMLNKFKVAAHDKINPIVARFILERKQNGEETLLATAAAECYVPLIWEGDFIASPMGGPDCRGVRKRDSVVKWAERRGLRITNFLTDHHEDLPLAKYAIDNGANVIIVNPSPKTISIINKELPSAILLEDLQPNL